MWRDKRGQLHDRPDKADIADAKFEAECILSECISGYDTVLEMDEVMKRAPELIAALQKAVVKP